MNDTQAEQITHDLVQGDIGPDHSGHRLEKALSVRSFSASEADHPAPSLAGVAPRPVWLAGIPLL